MSSDEVEVEACDWSTLKKKKKKPLQPPAPPPSEEPSDVEADYTYLDLLQRLYRSHREQHPEAATATTAPLHLPLPRLARQGGKHMVLLNFGAICQQLQRGLPHVQAFFGGRSVDRDFNQCPRRFGVAWPVYGAPAGVVVASVCSYLRPLLQLPSLPHDVEQGCHSSFVVCTMLHVPSPALGTLLKNLILTIIFIAIFVSEKVVGVVGRW